MKLLEKESQIKNGIISAEKKHIAGDFAEHGHKFFEMEYIISGSGTYIIDGREYSLCERRLFLMSPSDFHSIKSCDAEIINVMFSCDLCDTSSFYRIFAPKKTAALDFTYEDSVLIEKLLLEIAGSRETEYMIQFLRSALYKCSNLIEHEKSFSDEYTHTYVQKTIVYILENFSKGITLSDAARHIKLAPAYLSALFAKETGTNFKNYLDNIRFEYTMKLLKFTNMPVLAVCSESGFSDYTNFVRRFKDKYGFTPSEYRKKHKSL